MSMENLIRAFEALESITNLGANFSGNKSEKLVSKAEKTLGLTFPPTYRFFLKKYGCGNFKYTEIYGIINENFNQPTAPDGVGRTLLERAEFNMPQSFIIIADAGDGPYYVIDTSKKNADGDSPVFIWDGDEIVKTEKINEDFGDFLKDRVQLALDNPDD